MTKKEKFIRGIVDWKGITDVDGKSIPCTEKNKAAVFDSLHSKSKLDKNLSKITIRALDKNGKPLSRNVSFNIGESIWDYFYNSFFTWI